MWWAEPALVYLGRDLLLVQDRLIQESVILREEWTFDEVHALLARLLPPGARVDVHLSAGLCPAVDLTYPEGMIRFTDQHAFAAATCARKLGLDPADLEVRLDPVAPRVAAPMRRGDLQSFHAWRTSGLRVRAIRPLWSVASALPCVRRGDVVGLLEQDGFTLMGAPPGDAGLRASSQAAAGLDDAGALSVRLGAELGLASEDAAILCFAVPGGARPVPAASGWRHHWAWV